MDNKIKIAIADDHELFRKGIITLLSEFDYISVVHESSNGKELTEKLKTKPVDIVLLDIEMPEMNGAETLKLIKGKFPHVKVIMLSMYNEGHFITDFIMKGANSFLSKNCDVDFFMETIMGVYQHHNYFKQNITDNIIKKVRENKKLKTNYLSLTTREIEITQLICKGNSHKQIASILFITPRTVDFHRSNIYKKTNTNCTAKLYEFALANNLVDTNMFNKGL